MPREKEKYRFDENRGVVRGRFHSLKKAGHAVPQHVICTIESWDCKNTKKGRKQRTVHEQGKYLERQYQKKLQQLQQQIEQDVLAQKTDAERTTLADVIERYLDKIAPRKSFAQQKALRIQLKYFKKRSGRRTLDKVTPAFVVQCRDALEVTGRATSTINRYLASLSVVMTACVEDWFLLNNNPVRNVKKLPEPEGRTRFLDEDELKMLLEECRNAENKLYLAVLLALSTGARQKEIWNLSWKDINLKDEFIIFSKTKTKKTRTVPLKGAVLEMLRNESRRLDTNMLFPSQKNPEKGFDFKRSFKKALVNAGIEDFSWHDLRHSCASYLIMSGMDMRKVAEILGHENLSMTKKYTHLKPEHLSDDMERMTRMFLNDA